MKTPNPPKSTNTRPPHRSRPDRTDRQRNSARPLGPNTFCRQPLPCRHRLNTRIPGGQQLRVGLRQRLPHCCFSVRTFLLLPNVQYSRQIPLECRRIRPNVGSKIHGHHSPDPVTPEHRIADASLRPTVFRPVDRCQITGRCMTTLMASLAVQLQVNSRSEWTAIRSRTANARIDGQIWRS